FRVARNIQRSARLFEQKRTKDAKNRTTSLLAPRTQRAQRFSLAFVATFARGRIIRCATVRPRFASSPLTCHKRRQTGPMRMPLLRLFSVTCLLSLVLCPLALHASAAAPAPAKLPNEAELKAMTSRFAPVQLTADTSALPANEKLALAKLVEAAKIIDA